MSSKMITREEATVLATKLRELSSTILGVELFGSTLMKGQGRDADFLILVADDIAREWWTIERNSIRVRWPDWLYGKRWVIKKFAHPLYEAGSVVRRKKRLCVAAKIVGISLELLADAEGSIPDFEMFLVPQNWRIDRELNMDSMQQVTDLMDDKNTRGFLGRIAKDAELVA